MNTQIYNFEVDNINFTIPKALETIVEMRLGHLTTDYTVLSMSVTITKENKYAIIVVIQTKP